MFIIRAPAQQSRRHPGPRARAGEINIRAPVPDIPRTGTKKSTPSRPSCARRRVPSGSSPVTGSSDISCSQQSLSAMSARGMPAEPQMRALHASQCLPGTQTRASARLSEGMQRHALRTQCSSAVSAGGMPADTGRTPRVCVTKPRCAQTARSFGHGISRVPGQKPLNTLPQWHTASWVMQCKLAVLLCTRFGLPAGCTPHLLRGAIDALPHLQLGRHKSWNDQHLPHARR